MSAFEAGSNTQCNQHNNIDPNNQNRERNESMLGDRDFWPAMSERVAGIETQAGEGQRQPMDLFHA